MIYWFEFFHEQIKFIEQHIQELHEQEKEDNDDDNENDTNNDDNNHNGGHHYHRILHQIQRHVEEMMREKLIFEAEYKPFFLEKAMKKKELLMQKGQIEQ